MTNDESGFRDQASVARKHDSAKSCVGFRAGGVRSALHFITMAVEDEKTRRRRRVRSQANSLLSL